jgi:hypothetical protein
MTDYGKGAVLGAATTLPATSAVGFLMMDGSHPYLVIGMIIVAAIALLSTSAYLTRYMVNRKG